MPGRAWAAAGAALLAIGGGLTYRHLHASDGCPPGMTAVGVPSGGAPVRWSACAPRAGRDIVLTNTGTETLLVSTQDGATLSWRAPDGSATAFVDLTAQTLASMTDLTPDAQAAGRRGPQLMLGPHQVVRVAAGTGTAAVTVSRDYYATARWALGQSIAGWAAGQAAAPAAGPVRDVILLCATDLGLPASYLEKPPGLGDVVDAAMSRPACLAAVRTLAPVDAGREIVYQITDMARQFERTLPAGVWADVGREAPQLIRAP